MASSSHEHLNDVGVRKNEAYANSVISKEEHPFIKKCLRAILKKYESEKEAVEFSAFVDQARKAPFACFDDSKYESEKERKQRYMLEHSEKLAMLVRSSIKLFSELRENNLWDDVHYQDRWHALSFGMQAVCSLLWIDYQKNPEDLETLDENQRTRRHLFVQLVSAAFPLEKTIKKEE